MCHFDTRHSFSTTESDEQTLQALIYNPNTISSVLEQLAQDEKVEVRQTVAKNPNKPAIIRERTKSAIV